MTICYLSQQLQLLTHVQVPSKNRAALFTVFFSSMAIVMGPTPPGTGVMAAAFSLHSSNAQSPTSRYPAFFVASSTGLVPTSMTTAPGLIQDPCRQGYEDNVSKTRDGT